MSNDVLSLLASPELQAQMAASGAAVPNLGNMLADAQAESNKALYQKGVAQMLPLLQGVDSLIREAAESRIAAELQIAAATAKLAEYSRIRACAIAKQNGYVLYPTLKLPLTDVQKASVDRDLTGFVTPVAVATTA